MKTFLDIFGTGLILVGIFYATRLRNAWLIYALGCLVWIYLSYIAGYRGGVVMNVFAIVIALRNWKNWRPHLTKKV